MTLYATGCQRMRQSTRRKTRLDEHRAVTHRKRDWPGAADISLDMPLVDLVWGLRPRVTLQQRVLHDPVLEEMTLRDLIEDPAGTWRSFRLVPGAGPVATEAFCEVVAEVLPRAGGRVGDTFVSRQQVEAVRHCWRSPSARGGAPSRRARSGPMLRRMRPRSG